MMKLHLLHRKPKKIPLIEVTKFTIEEVRKYLHHWDSVSDALFHLSEEEFLRVINLAWERPEPENFSE